MFSAYETLPLPNAQWYGCTAVHFYAAEASTIKYCDVFCSCGCFC